jgi:hypothetical protein
MDANPGRIFRNHYGVRADVTAAAGNVRDGRYASSGPADRLGPVSDSLLVQVDQTSGPDPNCQVAQGSSGTQINLENWQPSAGW